MLLLGAAAVWGLGNAITGLTAHRYNTAKSVLPSLDIAFANILGGLIFLILCVGARKLRASDVQVSSTLLVTRYLAPGAFKGANTCLFVLSATHIVASKSLVLESTYVLWALLFGALLHHHPVRFRTSLVEAGLLIVGAALVMGTTQWGAGVHTAEGIGYGLAAGISYAIFLLQWGQRADTGDELRATQGLLAVALITTLVFAQLVTLVRYGAWWTPFAHVRAVDIGIQTANGVLGVGLTYLLITVAMSRLATVKQGVAFITSVGLAFSLPFTVLAEIALGRFAPSVEQYVGLCVFMTVFVMLSTSLQEMPDG